MIDQSLAVAFTLQGSIVLFKTSVNLLCITQLHFEVFEVKSSTTDGFITDVRI